MGRHRSWQPRERVALRCQGAADREARNRAREGAPGQCAYKAVMTDQDLEQCRQASR